MFLLLLLGTVPGVARGPAWELLWRDSGVSAPLGFNLFPVLLPGRAPGVTRDRGPSWGPALSGGQGLLPDPGRCCQPHHF